MKKEDIARRVAALRRLMKEMQLDAFVFPSTDPHHGEYVPDHWKGREWISGFDGSAGTAVVTMEKAALWTDSRYFIAAADQLKDTEFALMRERVEGTPSVAEWIGKNLGGQANARVGLDGMVNSASEVSSLTVHPSPRARSSFTPLNSPESPLARKSAGSVSVSPDSGQTPSWSVRLMTSHGLSTCEAAMCTATPYSSHTC